MTKHTIQAAPIERKRVIVCGPATCTNALAHQLRDILTALLGRRGPFAYVVLFPGRSTSDFALSWALDNGIHAETPRIDRSLFAGVADRVQNTQVLNRYQPHFIVAIPGDKVTDDLVRKAKERSIEVIEISIAE